MAYSYVVAQSDASSIPLHISTLKMREEDEAAFALGDVCDSDGSA